MPARLSERLMFNLVGAFAAPVAFDQDSFESLRSASIADAVGLGAGIVAAVLAIVVVRRATAMQTQRAARLRASA